MSAVFQWMVRNARIMMFVVAFTVELIYLLKMKKRLPCKNWQAVVILAIGQVYCAVSAFMFGMIELGKIEGFATMRLYGAVFLCPLLFYAYGKVMKWDMASTFDVLTIFLIFGLTLLRLNCILVGCCTSIELDFLGGRTLPIREVELAIFICFIIIMLPKIRKQLTHGEVYPLFLICYGVYRFVIEFFREEYFTFFSTPIHWGHIWSVISVVAGTVAYVKIMQNLKYNSKKRKKLKAKAKR